MKLNKEQRKTLYGELGRYFIDLSKLIFGGIILAGIMKMSINLFALILLGTIISVVTAYVGLEFTILSKNK